MKRGDLVIVAAAGDYGKPRPAVVVQTNVLPSSHASVIICQLTSELMDTDVRVTLELKPEYGLRVRSQIMADKPTTIRRSRIGKTIGQLNEHDMLQLNTALAFVLGLAD